MASDPVRKLRELGIVVEESQELRHALEEHSELVELLRWAAALVVNRLPMATLILRWYVDPEVSGDEYPVLLVRLPSYDDDQDFIRFLEAIRDANQVLASSPVWVLATTDFGVGRDGENRNDAGDTGIMGGA